MQDKDGTFKVNVMTCSMTAASNEVPFPALLMIYAASFLKKNEVLLSCMASLRCVSVQHDRILLIVNVVWLT